MTIGIVRTNWSGTSGGPGLTQLAVAANPAVAMTAAEAQTAVDAVRTFWNAQAGNLPNELVLTVSPTVDQYDEVTGDLTASVTAATPPASVAGTNAGVYAAGAGYKVQWETGVIRNSRRVRGSTYVVPAASNVYTANGEITSTVRTAVNTASASLISTLTAADLFLVVWSRPLDATDPNGPRSGVRTNVSTGTTSVKTAFQRGRRD